MTLIIHATRSCPNTSIDSSQDSKSSGDKGSGINSGSSGVCFFSAATTTAAGGEGEEDSALIGMRADNKEGLETATSALLLFL